jgi:hypothetical protein
MLTADVGSKHYCGIGTEGVCIGLGAGTLPPPAAMSIEAETGHALASTTLAIIENKHVIEVWRIFRTGTAYRNAKSSCPSEC